MHHDMENHDGIVEICSRIDTYKTTKKKHRQLTIINKNTHKLKKWIKFLSLIK